MKIMNNFNNNKMNIINIKYYFDIILKLILNISKFQL